MNIKTPTDLATLQKQYDTMVEIALRSIRADIDLEPKFERELMNLMRTVKSMGGNVR